MVSKAAGVANHSMILAGMDDIKDAVSGKRLDDSVVIGERTGEARTRPEDVRLAAWPMVWWI